MNYLIVSRQFPKGHIRQGEDTNFVEKIWSGLNDSNLDNFYKTELSGYWANYQKMLQTNTVPLPKFHIIQKGNRWKVGDMASLRVWRDTPHRNFNKQIEFTKVEMTQEEFDSLPEFQGF